VGSYSIFDIKIIGGVIFLVRSYSIFGIGMRQLVTSGNEAVLKKDFCLIIHPNT